MPVVKQQDDWFQHLDQTFATPPFSPPAQLQHQEVDELGESATEREQTDAEIIERLQETVTLVDKLKEAEVLEKRLREVRALEGRLQDVDELAERLQEAIEGELGKEEIVKLSQEEGDFSEKGMKQSRSIVRTVVKRSVKQVEAPEEGEVDELEEQIKQVFFGSLLPEEGKEVEIKKEVINLDDISRTSVVQMSEKLQQIEKQWQDDVEQKLKSGSLDDTGRTSVVVQIREKLQQIEKDWQDDVEQKLKSGSLDDTSSTSVVDQMSEKLQQIEKLWKDDVEQKLKSGSLDDTSSTSVVVQRMERRSKKRVTIVEERWQQQGDMEEEQMQPGLISEERLEKEQKWHKTELDDRIEKVVIKVRQAEDFMDIWFKLFDRSPSKAVFKPSVAVVEPAEMDAGEQFTSKIEITTVVEKSWDAIVQESQGEGSVAPEVAPAQTVRERVDDWFVLLDVVRRATSYVPQVTLKERGQMDAGVFAPEVDITTDEERREVIVEVIKRGEEEPRYLEEIPQQPMRERDDDWFVLLEVVRRETTYVPPVSLKERVQMAAEVSEVDITAEEERREVIVEEIQIKRGEEPRYLQEIPQQPVRERDDDDWFVLLDVVRRETSYVPPVAVVERVQVRPEGRVTLVEMTTIQLRTEKRTEVVVEDTQMTQDMSPKREMASPLPVREIEDVWFVLLDVSPRKPSFVPPVTREEYVQVYPEQSISTVKVVTVESRKEATVVEIMVQKEDKMLLEQIIPQQKISEPVMERHDDWFVLLDGVPREVVYLPPVSLAVPSKIDPDVLRPVLEVKTIEQKAKLVVLEQIRPQPSQPIPERDDDWFVLFEATRQKAVVGPPVAPVELIQDVSKTSVVDVMTTETSSTWKKVTTTETRTLKKVIIGADSGQDETSLSEMKWVHMAPPSEREGGDDWFVVFDIIREKAVFIPPVALAEHIQDVSKTSMVEMMTTETSTWKTVTTTETRTLKVIIGADSGQDETRLSEIKSVQMAQPSEREGGDDWFVVFDIIREKAVFIPPVTPVERIQDVSKMSVVDVTTDTRMLKKAMTTETRTLKTVTIGADSRQDETSLSEIKVVQMAPPSDREGGDDWFVVFDIIREKAVSIPPVALAERIQDVVAAIQPKPKVLVEDVKAPAMLVEIKPPQPREVEDDWFMLLDVAAKVPVAEFSAQKRVTIVEERWQLSAQQRVAQSKETWQQRAQQRVATVEETWQQGAQQRVTIVEETWQQKIILQQSTPQPLREAEDDWFILLDVSPKKSVAIPERIQINPEVRAAVKVPPIQAKSRIAIAERRPQFEKRILEERRPPTHRDDDWFVLLDGDLKESVVGTHRGTRPVSAPVFSQAALAEAGIPMALDQPQTSTPIKTSRQDERKLEVTIEAVEPSKTEVVVKEFDKPQEDLLRHHASISELKRNFMEAVPATKPSEWDKRLSTHSPFRTLGINGQPLPSADGPPLVQTQTVTITAVSNTLSSDVSTTEVPIVPTKTITYESSKVAVDGTDEDKDGASLSSSSTRTITSETTSGTTVTTTTTHISKVVKTGSSETRVEKRIVITADSEADQEVDGGASAM